MKTDAVVVGGTDTPKVPTNLGMRLAYWAHRVKLGITSNPICPDYVKMTVHQGEDSK